MKSDDRAKVAYLRLAIGLIGKVGAASAVDGVSMAAAAATAGVSRQTLYRMWGSQAEFHDALLAYTAEQPVGLSGYDLLGVPATWSGQHDTGIRIEDLIRIRCESAQERLIAAPRLQLDLCTLAFDRPDQIVNARERVHGTVVAQVSEQVSRFAHFARREDIGPIRSSDIGALIWSLSLGLHYLSRFPGFAAPISGVTVNGESRSEVGVFALGVLALLSQLTESAPPGPIAVPARPNSESSAVNAERLADRADTMASWSAEQRLMLTECAQLLDHQLEEPMSSAFSSLDRLSLTKLARHAKVSRRTLYNVWPDQHAFEVDLNEFVHGEQIAESRRQMEKVLHKWGEDPCLLMKACDHLTEWRQQDPDVDHRSFNYAFLRKQSGDSGQLRTEVDNYSSDLRKLLTTYVRNQGLRMADEVHPNAMGCVLSALSVGSKALHLLAPTALRSHLAWRGGTYSVYAIGYQAIADFCLAPGPIEPK